MISLMRQYTLTKLKFMIARLRWLGHLCWAIQRYALHKPEYLWSRGWYRFADWSGSNNWIYPVYPTRYRISSLHRLRGKKGVIWLRLGSDPPKPEYDNGAPGDVTLFSRKVVGQLGGPVVLITSDGDRSIPSGLPAGIADAILDCPNILEWYTQNLDDPETHPKLKPLPIGIDLHSPTTKRYSGPPGPALRYL